MKVGDIVISISGHDMGEWYIVKDVLGEFVYLIDGKLKTMIIFLSNEPDPLSKRPTKLHLLR